MAFTGQGVALFAEYCRGWIFTAFFLVDGRKSGKKIYAIYLHPGKLTNMDPKDDGLEEDVSWFFLLTMGISTYQALSLGSFFFESMESWKLFYSKLERLPPLQRLLWKVRIYESSNRFGRCQQLIHQGTWEAPMGWGSCQKGLLGNKFEAQVAWSSLLEDIWSS